MSSADRSSRRSKRSKVIRLRNGIGGAGGVSDPVAMKRIAELIDVVSALDEEATLLREQVDALLNRQCPRLPDLTHIYPEFQALDGISVDQFGNVVRIGNTREGTVTTDVGVFKIIALPNSYATEQEERYCFTCVRLEDETDTTYDGYVYADYDDADMVYVSLPWLLRQQRTEDENATYVYSGHGMVREATFTVDGDTFTETQVITPSYEVDQLIHAAEIRASLPIGTGGAEVGTISWTEIGCGRIWAVVTENIAGLL